MSFRCHNTEHRYFDIASMPLNSVNYPDSDALTARRSILEAAIAALPERFECVIPQLLTEPISFGINSPIKEIAPQDITPHSSFN